MSDTVARSELIPLEELIGDADADEWLEWARRKLMFRSHCAMHRALAEATGLKYSCIHKALSGRKKAKRIRASLKRCLHGWLQRIQEGEEIDVDDEHRAVPVEDLQALLPRLNRKFRTKEEMYRCISKHTDPGLASVRRYFQATGQLKHAPLSVYRFAHKLAMQSPAPKEPSSYLADEQVRTAAGRIAREANRALKKWQRADSRKARMQYKQLRHILIATLKKQHVRVPVSMSA